MSRASTNNDLRDLFVYIMSVGGKVTLFHPAFPSCYNIQTIEAAYFDKPVPSYSDPMTDEEVNNWIKFEQDANDAVGAEKHIQIVKNQDHTAAIGVLMFKDNNDKEISTVHMKYWDSLLILARNDSATYGQDKTAMRTTPS